MDSPTIVIESPKSINSTINFSSNGCIYPEITASRDFIARKDNQLTVFLNDKLELLDDITDPDWTLVRETFSGKIGYIPCDICESETERQAKMNAHLNSSIRIPYKASAPIDTGRHKKSVSFAANSPEVIPTLHQFSSSSSLNSPPIKDDVSMLEDKLEAELNIRRILEDSTTQQSPEPNSSTVREEVKLLRIYCGNVNGPSGIVYKTITANDSMTWMQIERKAAQKFANTASMLDLVHSVTHERVPIPSDFNLAQTIKVAKYLSAEESARLPNKGKNGHVRMRHFRTMSEIKSIIKMIRIKTITLPERDTPSVYRLVINSNVRRTNFFKLKIKQRKQNGEEASMHLTVDYNDKISGIKEILGIKHPRVYMFGRLGTYELLLTQSGTISDAMRLFDCGPDGGVDPSAFELIINEP